MIVTSNILVLVTLDVVTIVIYTIMYIMYIKYGIVCIYMANEVSLSAY